MHILYNRYIHIHFIKSFVLFHKGVDDFHTRNNNTTPAGILRDRSEIRTTAFTELHGLGYSRLPGGGYSCAENDDVAHEIYVIIQTYTCEPVSTVEHLH